MIVVFALAAVAVAWRLATRRFTPAEWVLLVIVLLNYLVLAGQMLCWGFSRFAPPESRYWYQTGVLLLGWAVWALAEASRRASRHFAAARFLLPLAVAAFAAIDVAMLVKPHVPGSRRHAYLQACDWAEARIRADWKGPAADRDFLYDDAEYHSLGRPAVVAHTGLLPYRLGGRHADYGKFGPIDLPDYIVDEERKVELPPEGRYELMEKARFGRRTFALYRRVDGGPK